MKIKEIFETATAGATSAGNIASIAGRTSYTGKPGQSGTKSPKQRKPKMQTPTDNALDNTNTSLFGSGAAIKR